MIDNAGYVIDTSAFVNLWRHHPRQSMIHAVDWEIIDNLIAEGRLIAPREVWKELEHKEDNLRKWAKEQSIFIDLDEQQINICKDILRKYPLVKYKKKTPPADADVFVIALAKARGKNWIVVADEEIDGEKLKIPYICQKMNPVIEYLLSWQFLDRLRVS